jgi:hypothetical protein
MVNSMDEGASGSWSRLSGNKKLPKKQLQGAIENPGNINMSPFTKVFYGSGPETANKPGLVIIESGNCE